MLCLFPGGSLTISVCTIPLYLALSHSQVNSLAVSGCGFFFHVLSGTSLSMMLRDHKFILGGTGLDVGREHHDLVLVAEQRCHFFQGHAFGLRKDDGDPYNADCTDRDEDLKRTSSQNFFGKASFSHRSSTWTHQIKLPANICKRRSSNLKVDQRAETGARDGKCEALGSKMVWVDLSKENDSCHVNATAVDEDEDVARKVSVTCSRARNARLTMLQQQPVAQPCLDRREQDWRRLPPKQPPRSSKPNSLQYQIS